MWIAIIFVIECFYLRELSIVCCRVLEKERKKKKRKRKESKTTRKGGILGFTPAYLFYLILTSNCFGQISRQIIVQELCDSRGGRPGLSVLTSLLVSVDVKLY